MDTTQEIRDLVDQIIDGNAVDSEKAFNDIMTNRVADRIDAYRQDVANNYFNPVDETEEDTDTVVEEGYIAEAVDVGDSDEAEDHHAEHARKTKPTHEWKDSNGSHHKVWHTEHEGKKATLMHTSEPGASSAPVMRLEDPGHHHPTAIKKSLRDYDHNN